MPIWPYLVPNLNPLERKEPEQICKALLYLIISFTVQPVPDVSNVSLILANLTTLSQEVDAELQQLMWMSWRSEQWPHHDVLTLEKLLRTCLSVSRRCPHSSRPLNEWWDRKCHYRAGHYLISIEENPLYLVRRKSRSVKFFLDQSRQVGTYKLGEKCRRAKMY